MFAAAIVSFAATGMLAVIYIAAVTRWWAQRIWRLIRSPVGDTPVAPPASQAGHVRPPLTLSESQVGGGSTP